MKIDFSRSSCTVSFEEFDQFAGKEVFFTGELVNNGFHLNKQSLKWYVDLGENKFKLELIEEDLREKLADYIVSKSKENFKFQIW